MALEKEKQEINNVKYIKGNQDAQKSFLIIFCEAEVLLRGIGETGTGLHEKYSYTQGCQMLIAVGKQRIESLYRTDSGEIELKEQMIKNNEAKAGTS